MVITEKDYLLLINSFIEEITSPVFRAMILYNFVIININKTTHVILSPYLFIFFKLNSYIEKLSKIKSKRANKKEKKKKYTRK